MFHISSTMHMAEGGIGAMAGTGAERWTIKLLICFGWVKTQCNMMMEATQAAETSIDCKD